MPKSRLSVGFNKMLEPDLVLLSAEDAKRDVTGELVQLREAKAIDVYMDDVNDRGEPDNLCDRFMGNSVLPPYRLLYICRSGYGTRSAA